MDKSKFTEMVQPLAEWAKADDKKRGVIIVALEENSDGAGISSDECVVGPEHVIAPALASISLSRNGHFAHLLQQANRVVAVAALMRYNEGGGEASKTGDE